jgi:hypothetical protein
MIRWWSAKSCAYESIPRRLNNAVEPSMSVNRNVSVSMREEYEVIRFAAATDQDSPVIGPRRRFWAAFAAIRHRPPAFTSRI